MSHIKLDREREVRLRNKAISQVEKRFKRPFIELMQLGQKLPVEEQLYILYAGLKHEDPQLTLERVEELVDEHLNLTQLMGAVASATMEAYGEEDEPETGKESNTDPQLAAE